MKTLVKLLSLLFSSNIIMSHTSHKGISDIMFVLFITSLVLVSFVIIVSLERLYKSYSKRRLETIKL